MHFANGILEDWRYRQHQEDLKKAEAYGRIIDHWKETVTTDDALIWLKQVMPVVEEAAAKGDKLAQGILDEIVKSVKEDGNDTSD